MISSDVQRNITNKVAADVKWGAKDGFGGYQFGPREIEILF